jgi:hypothetical protein
MSPHLPPKPFIEPAADLLNAAVLSKNASPVPIQSSYKRRSGTTKRLSRIARRAIPEVAAAYRQGLISARKADELLYLPPLEQLEALNRFLAERTERQRRSQVAAKVLHEYITRGCLDLIALRRDLETALAPAARP